MEDDDILKALEGLQVDPQTNRYYTGAELAQSAASADEDASSAEGEEEEEEESPGEVDDEDEDGTVREDFTLEDRTRVS